MKFYLISDNIDTKIGLRLSGIEGTIVHTPEEAETALKEAMELKDVGIVLMTDKAVELCRDRVYDYKLSRAQPLIVEIPDRHATSGISETISRYLQEAVGIKL